VVTTVVAVAAAVVALTAAFSTDVTACAYIDPAPLSCFPHIRLAIFIGALVTVTLGLAAGITASLARTKRNTSILTVVAAALIIGACAIALPILLSSR
jgi:hypothetical protein